jgi:hypothetical protein
MKYNHFLIWMLYEIQMFCQPKITIVTPTYMSGIIQINMQIQC